MGKFPQPAILKFDPEQLEGELAKVFKDDLARVLWMAIKPGHLTSQFFDRGCLTAASRIRDYGELDSSERLRGILGTAVMNVSPEFAKDLLPYVTGEKEFEYEVRL